MCRKNLHVLPSKIVCALFVGLYIRPPLDLCGPCLVVDRERTYPPMSPISWLDNNQILIGVGDMVGPPGSDPSPYSSASISVDISSGDTVRDVKKKLITLSEWTDERPEDFGLFDDTSVEPLKDALSIESALSVAKPASAGRIGGTGNRRAGGWGRIVPMRLPSPYVGLLWAARTG